MGKTTTVLHLAADLASRGQRVLAVDLDPQGHLTVASRVPVNEARGSALEVLTGQVSMSAAVITSPHGFDVLAADQALARIERDGHAEGDTMYVLRSALDAVATSYDICLIDTPPSLGVLSTGALLAADAGIVVPLLPEAFPLKGMQLLLQTMGELRAANPNLYLRTLLPTMVRPRWATHRDMTGALPTLLPGISVAMSVPSHGAIARAATQRETIFSLAPRSAPAQAYRSLAESIING